MAHSPAPRSDGGDAAGSISLDALRRLVTQASAGDPAGEDVRVDGVLLDLLVDAGPAAQTSLVETARALSPDLGERVARLAWAFSTASEAEFLSLIHI